MQSVTLILPIAGASSRFPNTRPKWMLTHPSGKLMITESIRGMYPEKYARIVVIALRKHEEQYEFAHALRKELAAEYTLRQEQIEIVLLEQETRNQPETVYEGIRRAHVTGAFVIKDCDNYFQFDIAKTTNGNFVAVHDLHDLTFVNPGNKSYVKIGDGNTVTNIVEKKIIGNLFCCGAYGFRDASDYTTYFERLREHTNLFVSHIIYQMILDKQLFFAELTKHYVDWGTLAEWRRFTKEYTTILTDLDGVLVENSGEHFQPTWGTTQALPKNVATLNALYDGGKTHIIVTTSRRESYRAITEQQLRQLGIHYHRLVMELPATARRILINDYSKTNPYPTATAINIPRNSDTLSDYLGDNSEH